MSWIRRYWQFFSPVSCPTSAHLSTNYKIRRSEVRIQSSRKTFSQRGVKHWRVPAAKLVQWRKRIKNWTWIQILCADQTVQGSIQNRSTYCHILLIPSSYLIFREYMCASIVEVENMFWLFKYERSSKSHPQKCKKPGRSCWRSLRKVLQHYTRHCLAFYKWGVAKAMFLLKRRLYFFYQKHGKNQKERRHTLHQNSKRALLWLLVSKKPFRIF